MDGRLLDLDQDAASSVDAFALSHQVFPEYSPQGTRPQRRESAASVYDNDLKMHIISTLM